MKKILFFIVIGALLIWAFVSHFALPLVIAISASLIWAFRADKKMWRTKPAMELIAMVEGTDWRYWQTALEELRRRGEDISRFVPRLVSGLVADSVLSRSAADAALKKLFPEFNEYLRGYLPTHDVAVSRHNLAALLKMHGVQA